MIACPLVIKVMSDIVLVPLVGFSQSKWNGSVVVGIESEAELVFSSLFLAYSWVASNRDCIRL